MSGLKNWHATAHNTSPDSANQIHSDEMAKAYGFKGGLVPGVTVSSYLIHPAVEAWGREWLTRGKASIVVNKPLYDGYNFDLELSNISEQSYQATLTDQEGTPCATGSMSLTNNPPPPPTLRGDTLAQKGQRMPPATRDEMQKLQEQGMFALAARWSEHNEMSSYLQDASLMPALHSFDGAAYANASFMLGLTNWVLAGNVYMNPWIHMQTDSQNYAIVEDGTLLTVECDIRELFEKKGHEFVDLNVDVYVADTGQAVMTAMLRAIYQLRAN
jgi:hypothetical protein